MRKDKSHYLIRKCKDTNLYEVIDLTKEGFPVVFTHESLPECQDCKSYLDEIEEYRSEENEI